MSSDDQASDPYRCRPPSCGSAIENPTLQDGICLYRLALEFAPDAILIVSEDGVILFVNRHVERVFGYSRAEMIGQSIEMLVPERFRAACPEERSRMIGKNKPRLFSVGELSGLRKDGTEFAAEILVTPIRVDDTAVLTAVIHDTTEQKRAESSIRRLSQRMHEVQEEERRHIARELHDSVGQQLALLKIELGNASSCLGDAPAEIVSKLAECAQAAEQSIAEVRTLSYLLYPPMLKDFGLRYAIASYLDGFTARSGTATTFTAPSDFGRFSPELEVALFRVLQEGLTNVHRHSGSRSAEVRLYEDSGFVVLEVKDHGKGISAAKLAEFEDSMPGSMGIGLISMRDRMKQFGGTLEISSGSAGTIVRAKAPYLRCYAPPDSLDSPDSRDSFRRASSQP